MLKLLEISWLMIVIITMIIAVYQFITDGWQSAVWMIFVTSVAAIMYSIRRRQRIRIGKEEQESTRTR